MLSEKWICLANPRFVPDRRFSEVCQLCRYRRNLVADPVRLWQRICKTIDRKGLRLVGVVMDVFGHRRR